MTPEERVERVKMALAEAGVVDPERAVLLDPKRVDDDPDLLPLLISDAVSNENIWRAFAVTGEAGSCWSCWSSGDRRGYVCTHDPITSPWPEVVR